MKIETKISLIIFVVFSTIYIGVFFLQKESTLKLSKPDSCKDVAGINLLNIPTKRDIAYTNKIQPAIFGLSGYVEMLKWMESLDKQKTFTFEFESFFGAIEYQFLFDIRPLVKNIDIIGYCPNAEYYDGKDFSNRIATLKAAYPEKKLLIGPCVELFDKVNNSAVKPTYLGFELFEKNFDAYLSGAYDHLIQETKQHRTDVFMFVTFEKNFFPDQMFKKLTKIVERATEQNLKLGYTFAGNKRLYEFILNHTCQ